MSDEKQTPRDAGMRYYVGDPCYVIDRDRWHTFCELLHEAERKVGSRHVGVHITWTTKNGGEDEEDEVFVISSPGGDATWDFDMTDDMEQKVSLDVDAGLLAIVPIDLCEDETGHDCGAWFLDEPTLETEDEQWVMLNDHYDKSSVACDECGGRMIEWNAFTTCHGYEVCEGCFGGCEDCSKCGGCTCDDGSCDCEACQACGEKTNTYHLDDNGWCDDCAEEEE
jgi:hypothetical protein